MKYLFLLLLITVFPSDSFSKMYKCIDSNEKVVYQTQKCSDDSVAEVISEKEYGIDYNRNENKFDYIEDDFVSNYKKIKKISNGERVNISKYAVRGATTAFYFYADWCGSCKKVGPEIEQMAQNSNNFALRKIDISKKDSPIKDQYKIKSVPYFIIYGHDGREISRGNSFNL